MVIILNGTRHTLPSCYEELTATQYQRIVSEWDLTKEIADRDYLKLFNILAGTDFQSLHATEENEQTVWNAIRWIIEQPFKFSETIPKALEIDGKALTIPRKVGALSIGQNIHLRQLIDKSKYLEENIVMATAVYLQPLFDGAKFDYDRSVELGKKIGDMPAYLIRPIGFFLLNSAWKSGRMHGSSYRKTLRSLIGQLRRMWPIWLSGNGSPRLQT